MVLSDFESNVYEMESHWKSNKSKHAKKTNTKQMEFNNQESQVYRQQSESVQTNRKEEKQLQVDMNLVLAFLEKKGKLMLKEMDNLRSSMAFQGEGFINLVLQ